MFISKQAGVGISSCCKITFDAPTLAQSAQVGYKSSVSENMQQYKNIA